MLDVADRAAMERVRLDRLEQALVPVLIATYFLLPAQLPFVRTSGHGLVLLLMLLVHAVIVTPRRAVSLALPYLLYAAAFLSSALVFGESDGGVMRSIGFGLLAGYLVAYSVSGQAAALPILGWLAPLFVAVALLIGLAFTLPDLGAVFPGLGALLDSFLHRGSVLAAAAVLLCAMATERKRSAFIYLGLFVVLVAVVITSIRGVWVGTAAGLLVFAVLRPRIRQIIIVVLLAVCAFQVVNFQARMLQERAVSRSDPNSAALASDILIKGTRGAKFREEVSSSGRVGYWLAGLRMWRAHPWFGVGPGRFERWSSTYAVVDGPSRDAEARFDPHNTLVAVLAETGGVGLVVFVAMLLMISRQWWLAWTRGAERASLPLAAVAAAFVAVSVVGLTWDVHLLRFWWITLGLVHGAGVAGRAQQ